MKNAKFIELLNLYVDRQISPADAALLEAEIQQNPERRKVYREYCQMQKACSILSDNFLTESPAEKRVSLDAGPRRFGLITYAMGFAAAAACVALVVVNRPVHETTSASRDAIASSTPAAAVNVASTPIEPTRPALHPAFPGIARTEARAAELAKAGHLTLDWMNQVQVQRVKVEDLWFANSPELQTRDLTLRNTRPAQGPIESTAFIFQK
jgi:hypothetical protein